MEHNESKIVTIGPTYYVDESGIYSRVRATKDVYQCIMTKEVFIEAYNKWIKGEGND